MISELERLAGSAELIHVALVQSEFERSLSLTSDIEDAEKYTIPKIVMSPAREPNGDEGQEIFSCNVECRLWVQPEKFGEGVSEDESYSSGRLKVAATYLIAFRGKDTVEISDACISHFCSTTGIMAIWPYFRSHCSHLTSEAGVSLPALPLRRAVYPVKESDLEHKKHPES